MGREIDKIYKDNKLNTIKNNYVNNQQNNTI